MKRFAVQVALLVLAGFSLPVSAFQPLVTDDTITQGSDRNQMEFSFDEDRARTAGDNERVRTVPLVYTRGLSERLDVFAGLSYARIRTESPWGSASGGGNPSFGAKWRFYESEKNNTSFAVKQEVFLPVSSGREDAGLGSGKVSGYLTLILTQEVTFGAIHINAGVGRERYRDTVNNPDATTTRASIAPVWNLTGEWMLALDLGTESTQAGGTRVRSNFLEFGAIYSPSKNVDCAVGILRSYDNAVPRTITHTITAGITWRFR